MESMRAFRPKAWSAPRERSPLFSSQTYRQSRRARRSGTLSKPFQVGAQIFFVAGLSCGSGAVHSDPMDDGFELVDPDGAQAFLRSFPAEAQRRGHLRFQDGAVQELTVEKPGAAYSAQVRDAAWKNDVSLYYTQGEGWDGFCSCPVEFDCPHVFAAMSALLAEHRTAVVRQLSTGKSGTAAARAALKSRQEFGRAGELGEQIVAATGKALSAEALRFLKQV